GRSNRQHEQWQRLVLLADQRDYRLPWARPRDALDVELLGELWKRDQHAFDQRAVPAIEMAARKGRIPEPGTQQKQAVVHHGSLRIMAALSRSESMTWRQDAMPEPISQSPQLNVIHMRPRLIQRNFGRRLAVQCRGDIRTAIEAEHEGVFH